PRGCSQWRRCVCFFQCRVRQLFRRFQSHGNQGGFRRRNCYEQPCRDRLRHRLYSHLSGGEGGHADGYPFVRLDFRRLVGRRLYRHRPLHGGRERTAERDGDVCRRSDRVGQSETALDPDNTLTATLSASGGHHHRFECIEQRSVGEALNAKRPLDPGAQEARQAPLRNMFNQAAWEIGWALLLAIALFTAGAGRRAQLTLEWVDNSGGAARFIIERRTGTTGTYAPIATAATGVTTYKDSAIVGGSTYCYRVKASNASGESGYSNET